MRKIIIGAALIAVALSTVACPDKGPAEKAGEKVDKAIDNVTHPNEGPIEKAGRKTDEAVDKTKDAVKDATK